MKETQEEEKLEDRRRKQKQGVSHFNTCKFQFSENTLLFSRDHGEEEEMTNTLKTRGKKDEERERKWTGSGRKGEEGEKGRGKRNKKR